VLATLEHQLAGQDQAAAAQIQRAARGAREHGRVRRRIAVVVDASVLIERTVDAVADELCEALRRRMWVAGEETPGEDRGGLAGWKAAGEALLDQDRRLYVVIDEYDLLIEGERGEGAILGRAAVPAASRLGADTAGTRLPGAHRCGSSPRRHGAAPQTRTARRAGRRPRERRGRAAMDGWSPALHRQFGSALRNVT
jgi:hypothetical protein